MKAAVVVFPGTNCDHDLDYLCKQVLGFEVVRVWHRDSTLPSGIDLVFLPGGFSFGDYLRPGAIAKISPIIREIIPSAEKGLPVVGICNGFQILCETGLLEGALRPNETLKFISRDVFVRVESVLSVCTTAFQKGEVLQVPVAHFDGRFYADDETLARLEDEERIVLRYCDRTGARADNDLSVNINGSSNGIAGIRSSKGNVVGFMPHPERAADEALARKYPNWKTDGARIFQGLSSL